MKLHLRKNKFFKTLAIITAVFCITNCKPSGSKTQEVVQHFASGEVSRRHFEVEGKKEGMMTEYYRDGKLRSERNFKNDKQTGRAVFYHPSGQVMEVQYFDENAMKQGGDSTFYEDGRLQMVLNFQDNKKHGYLRKWSPEGTLIYEARYDMDTLVEVKGQVLKKQGN